MLDACGICLLVARLLHLLVAQGFRPLAYAAAEILRVWGQLDAKEHKGKVSKDDTCALFSWQGGYPFVKDWLSQVSIRSCWLPVRSAASLQRFLLFYAILWCFFFF